MRLFFLLATLVSSAVIGIDFGSEFVKIALVRPGSPFHIVVDEMTKRKIENVVGFAPDERVFGNHASGLIMRKPERAFQHLQRLLGNTQEDKDVKEFAEFGYFYNFAENFNRTESFLLALDEEKFSPEELVAMLFEYIGRIAAADAEAPVKDCVITVPEHWNQDKRQALLDAAEIAGLNVLSLINDNTAAAVQYGIDKKFESGDAPHRIVIYNMGSSSTQVTLVEYSSYASVEKKQNKTIGQFEILGSASDTALGGRYFDQKIVDFLLSQARKNPSLAGTDLTKIPRAMAKLRAAANKAKTVLSANKDTPIAIPSLHSDFDLQTALTREEFYSFSDDLFQRVTTPVEKLLEAHQIKPEDISAVVAIGGSVRVKKVQEILKAYFKKDDLTWSLNGDEAIAFGAVFRAANLSTAFRVRPLGMIDSTSTSVDLELRPQSSEGVAEEVKRTALFPAGNKLNRKKTVSLSHTGDVLVRLHNTEGTVAAYNVTGLNEILANPKNAHLLTFQNEPQKPRVSLQFVLDNSGMVLLGKAEAAFDEIVKVPVKKNKTASLNDTATQSETGSGSSEAEKDKSGEGEAKDAKEAQAETTDAKEGQDATQEPKEPKEPKDPKDPKDPKEGQEASESAATDADSKDKDAKNTKKEEEIEYAEKKVVKKLPLKIYRLAQWESEHLRLPFSQKEIRASQKVLQRLRDADEDRKKIAETRNQLESIIYNTRSLLDEESTEAVSTAAERDTIRELLANTEEWLQEQSDDGLKKFQDKMAEVNQGLRALQIRVTENIERPKAVNQTQHALAFTRKLLDDFEKDRPWISSEDREKLRNMTDEVETWMQDKLDKQAALAPTDDPAFLAHQLIDKFRPVAKLAEELARRKKPEEKKEKDDKKKTHPKPKGKTQGKTEEEKAEESAKSEKSEGSSETKTEQAESTTHDDSHPDL